MDLCAHGYILQPLLIQAENSNEIYSLKYGTRHLIDASMLSAYARWRPRASLLRWPAEVVRFFPISDPRHPFDYFIEPNLNPENKSAQLDMINYGSTPFEFNSIHLNT